MYEIIAIPQIENSVARTVRVDSTILITDQSHLSNFKWNERDIAKNCKEIRGEWICQSFLTWNRKQTCELAIVVGI